MHKQRLKILLALAVWASLVAPLSADEEVRISNYTEKLVYWKDFAGPAGLEIQFTVDVPFTDSFILFNPPILMKHPLPADADRDSGGGTYARNRYRSGSLAHPYFINSNGKNNLPGRLVAMKSLGTKSIPYRGNTWPTWKEINLAGFNAKVGGDRTYRSQGGEKVELHYVFYPGFIDYAEADRNKICLRSTLPGNQKCSESYADCAKEYEQQFLLEIGDRVTALFSYNRSSQKYVASLLDLIPNPHGGFALTPLDLSEALTDILGGSILNADRRIWGEMQKQFMPSNLISKGYRFCGTPQTSNVGPCFSKE